MSINPDHSPKPESMDEVDQAAVTVNEDGTITLAQSGEVAKAPPAQQWTGIDLKPDPRFGSMLAAKFINCLMYDGKKSTAQQVFYGAMDILKERIADQEPIAVFQQALDNVKPSIEVRSKRVGGAAYQVPMQVNRTRQQSLAIRWVLLAIREKKGRATAQKLADELAAAYNREGAAVSRRENVHRMADANKAFAHFGW